MESGLFAGISNRMVIQELRRNLAYSQRNHHARMLVLLKEGFKLTEFHTGIDWQKCPEQSCKRIAQIWRLTREFETDA